MKHLDLEINMVPNILKVPDSILRLINLGDLQLLKLTQTRQEIKKFLECP